MDQISDVIERLVVTGITIGVMVILATLVFFVTTFVVSLGSSLAGYDPSGDFVVLSAALIVVAVILAGGVTGQSRDAEYHTPERLAKDDPTYE